jgi:hypothetical protein
MSLVAYRMSRAIYKVPVLFGPQKQKGKLMKNTRPGFGSDTDITEIACISA